jgi:RsiW-degrading membrane proteinase PrsW (M82 family)
MNHDQPGGKRSSLLVQGRLKLSELFPLASQRRAPLSSAYFAPVLLTLAVMVVLVSTLNDPVRTVDDVQFAMRAVMVWMAVAGLLFLHLLCGRIKPWWWIAGGFVCAAGLTAFERQFNYPFLGTIESLMPDLEGGSFISRFIHQLINTAVPEELFKVLPILALVLLNLRSNSPLRQFTRLTPIAAVLLGAACGAGFTLVETDQYVNDNLNPGSRLSPELRAEIEATQPELLAPDPTTAFIQLLFRMIGQFSMHAAWTGSAGYYIALGLLNPARLYQIAGGGLLLSGVMHAAWNSTEGVVVEWIVAVTSYAVFASAVLKGQQLSMAMPEARDTARTLETPGAQAVIVPPPAVAATRNEPPKPHQPEPKSAAVRLRLGQQVLELRPGDIIRAQDVPGFGRPGGDGHVGDIVTNPHDPGVWGLRNRSNAIWRAVVRPGDEREVKPGHSVRLAHGVTLHLDGVTIQVERDSQ